MGSRNYDLGKHGTALVQAVCIGLNDESTRALYHSMTGLTPPAPEWCKVVHISDSSMEQAAGKLRRFARWYAQEILELDDTAGLDQGIPGLRSPLLDDWPDPRRSDPQADSAETADLPDPIPPPRAPKS